MDVILYVANGNFLTARRYVPQKNRIGTTRLYFSSLNNPGDKPAITFVAHLWCASQNLTWMPAICFFFERIKLCALCSCLFYRIYITCTPVLWCTAQQLLLRGRTMVIFGRIKPHLSSKYMHFAEDELQMSSLEYKIMD